MTTGLWNIGGYNLPDFGISEALGLGNVGSPVASLIPNNANTVPGYNQAWGNNIGPQAQVNTNPTQPPFTPPPTNNTGNVLGAAIQPTYNAPTSSDPYAGIRNDISSGWDNYLSSLNDTANTYLPQQRDSQTAIANSQLTQATTNINNQKAKSLRDIGDNIAAAFKAGNNYLGMRGAGDSSAANQYSYALSREAGKQTSNLNEYVNNQLQNLSYQHDQQISQIANWFSGAQMQLKQMIAQGQLSKSQDINNLSKSLLDQAIQAKNQVTTNAINQKNSLLQWAEANSHSVDQLASNLSQIPQKIALPMVDSTGNYPQGYAPLAYGNLNDQSKKQLSWFQ